MKIVNHDIRTSGPSWLGLSRLYSSRALCITEPGDVIQLHADLRPQWPIIQAHYENAGISFTQDVVWDTRLERTQDYPDHKLSAFFFGEREHRFRPDARRREITEFLNSKNNLITLAREMGVPVPETRCFDRISDAEAQTNEFSYPCYVKPAIALSGIGISRCANPNELRRALGKLQPDIPVQIQNEVQAERFLNVQYVAKDGRVERLLTSEQIVDGNAHSGNRVPACSEPWPVVDALAGWIAAQGMQDIFAFDIAMVNDAGETKFYLLECNPRFNAVSYPTLVAQKIHATHWSTVTVPTAQRDLQSIDLEGIAYDPQRRDGVILINWGAILHGKLMIMLVGTEERQKVLLDEFKQRVSVQAASRLRSTVLLTPKQMERVSAGRWRNLTSGEVCITGVNFYLPWVKSGDLFILRERDKATRADYARDLLKAADKGAVAAVVQKNCIEQSALPLLEVENVGKAFQDIALASSLSFDDAKVLVTGSHGKTGFKTQLFHVLNNQIPTHACIDSANLQHPVWRALSAIPKAAKVAIIEAAVPAAGIGQDRSFFIRPDFCVITGIGPEHLSSHKSIGNLILNKAAVVTGLRPGGKCVLNADDPCFDEVRAAVKTYSDCDILAFGSSLQCAGRLISQHFANFQWEVSADILGETVRYTLPMIEDYAPLASVGVLLVAKLLGADPQRCASEYPGYKNFESSGNLYEVQLDQGSFYVYDQSRRGEWKGFESMFELMSRLKPARNGRKVAVLSEFINLDDNPNAPVDFNHMQGFIEKAGIDLLYSVHRFKEHSAIVSQGTQWKHHGETVAEIQDELIAEILPDDMVFIRGIEDARLDKLINKLVELGKSVRKLF